MTKIEQELMAIETMIYIIRGQRVMIDNDLAALYGVETKVLNQAVNFEVTNCDLKDLSSKIGDVEAPNSNPKYFNFYSLNFRNIFAAHYMNLSKGDLMTKIEKELMAIETMIYIIRDQRVMIDSDLAKLYGVETKQLNRQVQRNLKRFPTDFMFQLTEIEEENLRCQFGTSSSTYGGRRYLPYVFTENGVAMLSSVLSSDRAIEINISIMRIFTKLRSFHALESNITSELKNFKESVNALFKVVFTRLDSIEDDLTPRLPSKRKKIGIKSDS